MEAFFPKQAGFESHRTRVENVIHIPSFVSPVDVPSMQFSYAKNAAHRDNFRVSAERDNRKGPCMGPKPAHLLVLPYSQEEQETEMDPQSNRSQSPLDEEELQDGVFGLHSLNASTERVYDVNRLGRRLLPFTSQPDIPPVDEIPGPKQSVPVQGPSDGSLPLPVGFVSSSWGDCETASDTDEDLALRGRHIHLRSHKGGMPEGYDDCESNLRKSRFRCKSRKVGSRTNAEISSSGFRLGFSSGPNSSYQQVSTFFGQGGETVINLPVSPSQEVGFIVGQTKSRQHCNASTEMEEESSGKRSTPVGPRRLEQNDQPKRFCQGLASLVQPSLSSSHQRDAVIAQLRGKNHDQDGCEPSGLGSHSFQRDPRSLCARAVEHGRGDALFQCQRTASSEAGLLCVEGSYPQETECFDAHRQYNSSGVSEGLWQDATSTGDHSADAHLNLEEEHSAQGFSHSRSDERGSRQAVSPLSHGPRLADFNFGVSDDPSDMGSDGHRFICRQDQFEMPPIPILGAGSTVFRGRCPASGLEQMPRTVVRLPPLADHSSMCLQAHSPEERRDTFRLSVGHPCLGGGSMVPNDSSIEASDIGVAPRIHRARDIGLPPNGGGEVSTSPVGGEDIVQRLREQKAQTDHERNKASKVARYNAWRESSQRTDEALSVRDFLAEEIIGEDVESRPTYQHFRSFLAAIDEDGRKRGLVSYLYAPVIQELVALAKANLFRAACKLNDPSKVYNPRYVIQKLRDQWLSSKSYENLRLMALLALRSVPLLRSGDCWSISRKSISVSTDIRGRKILIFQYCGKLAKILKVPNESNFIEFLDDDLAHVCPATLVWQLKTELDTARVQHDSLFTYVNDKTQVMKSQSLGPIIKKALIKLGLVDFSAHSVRAMTSEFLELVGDVSDDQITLRSWKAKKVAPSTRLLHYRSRVTVASFADLLWNPRLTQLNTCFP